MAERNGAADRALELVIAQIEGSALAGAIRASAWAYPVLEALHIMAIATVFGSLLLFELRVFGAAAELGLRPFARLAVRTALFGLLFAVATGALMWSSDASALSGNPAFLTKLSVVALAVLNAAVFHWRDSVGRHDRTARVQAGISLLLWIGAIFAGRLIAYV